MITTTSPDHDLDHDDPKRNLSRLLRRTALGG